MIRFHYNLFKGLPMPKRKTILIMVLDDGETFSGLANCTIQEVYADDSALENGQVPDSCIRFKKAPFNTPWQKE